MWLCGMYGAAVGRTAGCLASRYFPAFRGLGGAAGVRLRRRWGRRGRGVLVCRRPRSLSSAAVVCCPHEAGRGGSRDRSSLFRRRCTTSRRRGSLGVGSQWDVWSCWFPPLLSQEGVSGGNGGKFLPGLNILPWQLYVVRRSREAKRQRWTWGPFGPLSAPVGYVAGAEKVSEAGPIVCRQVLLFPADQECWPCRGLTSCPGRKTEVSEAAAGGCRAVEDLWFVLLRCGLSPSCCLLANGGAGRRLGAR